jgi:hypothetical protein
MLDARPDEDDPVFNDRSRRASQRLNTDLGCRPSRHRRASLGSLIDGRRQGKPGHAPQLTSDNDAQGETRSRIRAPVPAAVDSVQETGVRPLSPLEREQLVGSVRLGIEWDDPEPGRSAPTASITLTQEAISGAATQLDSDMDRDHDGEPDRVEESEHNTVLESHGETVELEPQLVKESSLPQKALHPQSDIDIGEAPSNLGRESGRSSLRSRKHQAQMLPARKQLAPASHVSPSKAHHKCIRPTSSRLAHLGMEVGNDTQLAISCNPDVAASSNEADGVDSSVGISCEATQDPDANYPPRLGEDSTEQGAVPSFLGSRSSSQLESGQTRGEISSSEALVGRAASPSEGSGVQVVFPRCPCPEAATLATWKVDPQSGSDSESTCTEVSASFEVAPVESGDSDRLHSDRDGHLLSVALSQPTPMDSKLELESDSDDDSKSGAHFWPFCLLPPIPTDETDADVHPDGDDQAPGRPEWEFAWA